MENRRMHLVPMIVCAAAMTLAAARTLNPNLILLSWDFEGHLLRAQVWLKDVAGAGMLSGWFPYWHGGFPMTEVYPPLATWLLALATLAGAPELGGRILLLFLWISAVPASFHFLRRFGASPWAASFGACLVGALDASRTFGVQAIYWLGLIPNALGFVLAILALAEWRPLVTGQATRRGMARAALLGGLTLLAHPFCAYWLAVSLLILFTVECAGRGDARARLTSAVIAAAGAAVLGAFYWVPFLAGRANLLVTDPFTTSGMAGTWWALAVMKSAGGLPALALATVGFAAMGVPQRRRQLAFFALSAGAGLCLSLGAAPLVGGFFGPSQAARFEGFYLWMLLMASAFAVDAALSLSSRVPRAAASAVVAAAIAVVAVTGIARQRVNAAVAPARPLQDLAVLSDRLRDALTPGDFILSENDRRAFSALGSPHLFNQRLPRLNASVWDAGGGLPEGTRAAMPMFALSRAFPAAVADAGDELARHGVRFVLTTRGESADELNRVPWLSRLWTGEDLGGSARLALFEVAGFTRLGLRPEISALLDEVSYSARKGYRIRFKAGAALSFPVETAISFHPWLRATVDGEAVALSAAPDGRLVLEGRDGEVHQLSIAYRPPWWISVVRILSLLALMGLFALVLRRSPTYP